MTGWRRIAWLLLVGAVWLTGCASIGPAAGTPSPQPTATPVPPSATPEPVAALVEGEVILLAEFEREVRAFERAQGAIGTDLATLGDYRSLVLRSMIDRKLLAQAARAEVSLSEEELRSRLEERAAELGGGPALDAWLAAQELSRESFLPTLEEEILAQIMVERIALAVPEDAEQVHARHILVASRPEAEDILRRLQGGADFAQLASAFSLDLSTRPGGGDLGWFPRGYLLVPEVEAAAFELAEGDWSEVIETSLGYHIVQTLERGRRPLSPGALVQQRERAVRAWLDDRWSSSQIEIFVAAEMP
jgi:peptidyl-prolyl cis-trans isomerase C